MEKWIDFLNEFTKGICNVDITQNDKGDYLRKTSGIFGLDVTLSTNYGFLEVLFPDKQVQLDFLTFANISKTTSVQDSVQLHKTHWNVLHFPCRLFVENSKIQFYDKTNDLPAKEKFERRVIVLQSIFNTMIEMKLHYSLPDDKGGK